MIIFNEILNEIFINLLSLIVFYYLYLYILTSINKIIIQIKEFKFF